MSYCQSRIDWSYLKVNHVSCLAIYGSHHTIYYSYQLIHGGYKLTH